MSLKAKAYLSTVLLAGFLAVAAHLPAFSPQDPFRFAAYFALAMVASGLKVTLPRIAGNISVLFLFVIIGIVELTLPETLIIAMSAVVVQSFWKPKQRPKPIQIAFNMASLAIAASAGQLVFSAAIFDRHDVPFPWRLAAAATVFFVGNTLTVAVIIALTEKKSIIHTWRSCYLWSFPYYLVGACIVGLFSSLTRQVGWQASILVLPVVYLIFRSYRLYLDHLEEGRLHAAQLEAAATRLTAVLESTTDYVFALDGAGRITYANQRATARLFGDVQGVGQDLFETFPKLAVGNFRDQIKRAIELKTTLTFEEFLPELNAWFEVHAFPSAEGVALYLKDVTEQRELSDQLRQAQKMEAVGRLAGGVAHDFNNLLTIILGYGQLAADLLERNHPAAGSITEVLKAGERASALTQRLLAFSRKQVLQPEILELNDVVSGVEGMLRRLIGEDVEVTVKLDPVSSKIRADHHQLEQVIMNLAINARDAMPNGGQITISTRTNYEQTSSGRDYAVLSVADTGHGMDAETKAKIFEPFFTTKGQGKGTGLGLSMVYGIVQQSGGYLVVHSEVGRGSVFHVYLPSVASGEKKTEKAVPVDYKGSGKVLLVEDEDAVRNLTARMLAQAGYSVTATSDAADALKLSRTELDDFDLLLTDVVMPGMSGPELAAHLLKRRPKLKVIYVSGYTDHPLITGADLVERAVMLQKPFTRDQLLQKIAGALADVKATTAVAVTSNIRPGR
jgi:signal transduction histidine kinase/ActR/RegA family two-component response regulator